MTSIQDTSLHAIERSYLRLVGALAGLSGVVLALVALLIPVNLLMRSCCDASLFGLLDAVEYGLMAATFLGAPWVLAQNAHVTVDIVTISLPRRVQHPLSQLVNVAGVLLSAILAWYAFSAASISFERGSMIRTAFMVPEWLTLIAPGISGTLLALEFCRRLWRGPEGRRSASGL